MDDFCSADDVRRAIKIGKTQIQVSQLNRAIIVVLMEGVDGSRTKVRWSTYYSPNLLITGAPTIWGHALVQLYLQRDCDFALLHGLFTTTL